MSFIFQYFNIKHQEKILQPLLKNWYLTKYILILIERTTKCVRDQINDGMINFLMN